MKLNAVSGMMLTLLLIGVLSASFEIREASANPTVRIYVEMPSQGYIPGIPVGQTLEVSVNIESPPEWTNTADGIVGWRMDVHANASVLEPMTVQFGLPGYWLYDFTQDYEYYGHEPTYGFTVDKPNGNFDDIGIFLKGFLPPTGIGVGAGGSGLLCKLRYKSKSLTAWTLIDMIDFKYARSNFQGEEDWLTADLAVIDGHYNAPAPVPLTISSSPAGVTFTVDGVSCTTPWSGTYGEGTSISLEMPESHDGYVWSHWLEDGDPNRMKTVTMDANISLTAVFTPPDTTPPTIFIIYPENNTYPEEDVPLTFNVSESTSWMGYSLDGQANITIAGNTTLTGLSDGMHSLVVYTSDMAGNIGSSDMVYFSIHTKKAEPLRLWIVATIMIIAVVGAALLVYFAKVKKKLRKSNSMRAPNITRY